MIVALKEMARVDEPIAELCRSALAEAGSDKASLLGKRLLENLTR